MFLLTFFGRAKFLCSDRVNHCFTCSLSHNRFCGFWCFRPQLPPPERSSYTQLVLLFSIHIFTPVAYFTHSYYTSNCLMITTSQYQMQEDITVSNISNCGYQIISIYLTDLWLCKENYTGQKQTLTKEKPSQLHYK